MNTKWSPICIHLYPFVILPGATISLMMRVPSIWPPRWKLDAPGQDIEQRFKRGWDNPWSNSFERFEDVLVDFLWVRCTVHSVSSKWLCSCLEIRGRNPIPYFTDLDSISQQSKFHSTDPESKRWVSRLYQLVLRNSVGYNGKYHTDIVVMSQHYISAQTIIYI